MPCFAYPQPFQPAPSACPVCLSVCLCHTLWLYLLTRYDTPSIHLTSKISRSTYVCMYSEGFWARDLYFHCFNFANLYFVSPKLTPGHSLYTAHVQIKFWPTFSTQMQVEDTILLLYMESAAYRSTCLTIFVVGNPGTVWILLILCWTSRTQPSDSTCLSSIIDGCKLVPTPFLSTYAPCCMI